MSNMAVIAGDGLSFDAMYATKKRIDQMLMELCAEKWLIDRTFATGRTIRAFPSGDLVDLITPDPETIHLEDMAHHLSLLNRFTGAMRRPYSVLEHSLMVHSVVDVKDGLAALAHDLPEAYLGDVSSPLKAILKPLYGPLEARFWQVIATKFGLPLDLPEAVHIADKRIREIEQRDLQGRKPLPDELRRMPLLDVEIPPERSRQELIDIFLHLFERSKLQAQLHAGA